jgi:hypothetical protein
MQFALLLAAGALACWGFWQHWKQREQLTSVQAEIQTQQGELDSRKSVLEGLERRNRDLREAEERAGNKTLLTLLRERNAAATAAAPAASDSPAFGSALAKVLDSPEYQDADLELRRSQTRAGLDQFFKLTQLSPDKTEQYIDLTVDMERRKASRLSALLNGRLTFAEALRERDNDEAETERRRHELLGDEGYAFLNGIADGMRNTEARRLLNLIQQNAGDNKLNPEQCDRLQGLLKTEIAAIKMDDVELFRPPDEWTQLCLERQQNILKVAVDFLAPAQLEMLKALGAYNLAEMQKQMLARRKSLGIK